MSTINNVNSASVVNAAAVTSRATIAENFDTFLQMLTTQLKNQNPLDPLDTNQFTQQLVQFSQVEQQLKTNDQLSVLLALQQATQVTSVVDYVGKAAVVTGDTTALRDEKATWSYTADAAGTATFTVVNAAGNTVYTEQRAIGAGTESFVWDGKGTNGVAQPNGQYTLKVSAKDANGKAVSVTTDVVGVVDGVDISQVPPLLKVGSRSFTLDKIKQIKLPTT
jgi:flagellar basal-body rod modification protein FlgD